jgi:hypothetical protein
MSRPGELRGEVAHCIVGSRAVVLHAAIASFACHSTDLWAMHTPIPAKRWMRRSRAWRATMRLSAVGCRSLCASF